MIAEAAPDRRDEGMLDGAAAAFAAAAAAAIVFNTALAWIKDAYDPLNTAMAALTGHHWITHGLADLLVFLVVGLVLLRRGACFNGQALTIAVVAAALGAAAGLVLWFVLR